MPSVFNCFCNVPFQKIRDCRQKIPGFFIQAVTPLRVNVQSGIGNLFRNLPGSFPAQRFVLLTADHQGICLDFRQPVKSIMLQAGSGQKELLECIAGLYPVADGTIVYTPEGAPPSDLVGKTPMQIKKAGVAMAFVPEDRLGVGLLPGLGMADNIMLRSFRKGKNVFTDRKSPRKLAQQVVERLNVKTPSIETPVRKLSGGNVQKVLVGREISTSPAVLMTAYAVRGLDINTSYTIYNLLTEQKMKGVAVIYVGEDLDVLLELCDRILVLCGGQVSGIVDGRTTTKEEVGLLMTRVGGKEEVAHA